MTLRNAKPAIWAPQGLSDAIDGSEDFPGAANFLSNLIPAQNQKGSVVPRVAALPVGALPDYGGGPISDLFTVGNMCYGMYPSATYPGYDRPFVYNMASGQFVTISGLSSGNLPLSPPASGPWTPPTAAQVGSRILFTHPGFPGGSTANTFWFDSVGNTVIGSNTLTGYPFYYGVPVGTILSDNTGVIPAGTTVVSQTIQNINVLASGTAGAHTFTVASGTGIFPGQPVFLPNGQWDTVQTVSGTSISLNNITISNTFTNVNVTFATSVIVMSNNATSSTTNLLIAATAPVSNKFGWLDISGFSINIIGNIASGTQPIINGFFDVTGIEPGMTVSGPSIASGTTVRAVGSLVFNVTMTTTTGSTNVSNIQFSGPPSPANYLAGTLQPGQLVQGPGLPPGTTFETIFGTIQNPYGQASTGSISVAASPGVTNGTFVVSSTFLILSQLPTGLINGASFTIAGGTAAAPLWGAGDVQGLTLANVPVFVAEYGGSACFGVNTTNPQSAAVVISDAGVPCQCTNASQVITFGGSVPVTAGAGLPLQSQLGGVLQSLIVFQGASNLQQITGLPALGNVSLNTSQVATGTLAPNSVASTPKGLLFIAPDGLRLLDFDGIVHDPSGGGGAGVVTPFLCATQPTRIAASFSGNIYRVTVTWQPPVSLQTVYGEPERTDEFWFHLYTGRFSGPHTGVVDLIKPWPALNSFICGLQSGRGQLWRSDPTPTPTSSYVENGTPLSWQLRTTLLPDDADDTAISLVESSVWGSMNSESSWQATLIDDQAQTQTNAAINLPSRKVTQSQLPIYWGPPAAFRQAAIQITGPSEPQAIIGSMRLRYQKLRYPLPSFPVFEGSPFLATPVGANVLDYAADPTGTLDCSLAFTNAMSASPLVVVPPGTYKFTAGWTVSLASGAGLRIVGAGAESVKFIFPGAGFVVTLADNSSSFSISGCSFLTQTNHTQIGITISTTATSAIQAQNIFSGLVFRGSDGVSATNAWQWAVQSTNVSNVYYYSCMFAGNFAMTGNGVNLIGTAGIYSYITVFEACYFETNQYHVNIGNYVQGVYLNNCNLGAASAVGIFVTTGILGLDQLTITGCLFQDQNSVAIDINSPFPNTIISGCYFLMGIANAGCMFFGLYANTVILGNCFTGASTGNYGVQFGNWGGSMPAIVTGNVFQALNLGINLTAGSQFVNVQSNVYSTVTTHVTNSGTNNTVGGGSQ